MICNRFAVDFPAYEEIEPGHAQANSSSYSKPDDMELSSNEQITSSLPLAPMYAVPNKIKARDKTFPQAFKDLGKHGSESSETDSMYG